MVQHLKATYISVEKNLRLFNLIQITANFNKRVYFIIALLKFVYCYRKCFSRERCIPWIYCFRWFSRFSTENGWGTSFHKVTNWWLVPNIKSTNVKYSCFIYDWSRYVEINGQLYLIGASLTLVSQFTRVNIEVVTLW